MNFVNTPPPSTHSGSHWPRITLLGVVRALIVLILIISLAVVGYLYYQTRQKVALLSTPAGQQQVAQADVDATLAKVSKLMILPNEEPVVATIVDAPALATQSAFYQNAQNGDELLVFPQSSKAIIYSPDRNVIVNSGPLIVDQDTASPSPSAIPAASSTTTKLKVEIRNGSTVAGKATSAAKQLDPTKYTITTGTAFSQNYGANQIINVTNKIDPVALQNLESTFSAKVTTLPPGEASSSADILVILGNAN